MELNRTISIRAMLCMFFLAMSLSVIAQEKPTVTATPQIEGKSVDTDGVINTILGEKISYIITVSGEYKSIIEASWKLTCNNTEVATSNELTDNLTFATEKEGLYRLTGTFTFEIEGNTEPETVDATVTNDVNLLAVPTLDFATPEKIYTYHEKEFEMKLSTDITEGEWRTSVESDNKNLKVEGESLSYKAHLSNTTNQTSIFDVTIKCGYFYAGTEIYDTEKTFNVNVFSKATIDYNTSKEINTAENGEKKLAISKTGGNPDGWTFQWKQNNQPIGSNNESLDVQVTPGNKKVTETYTVTAVNGYDEDEYFEDTRTFTLNIFPETSLDYVSDSIFSTKSEETIKLEVKGNGGYEYGWEYVWTKDGEQMSCNTPANEISVVPGTDTRTEIYKVKATNKYNGAELATPIEKKFTVVIYAEPRVEKVDFRNAIVGGIQETCSVNYYGGNPDDWRFKWFRNGVEIPGADGNSYSFTETNKGEDYHDCTYSVSVENYLDTVRWYNDSIQFNFKVFPDLTVDYKMPEGKIAAYNETITLGAEYTGGCNADGNQWIIEWSHNGRDMQNDKSTYEHISNNRTTSSSTDKYNVHITHIYDGDILYEEVLNYEIQNYPLAEVKASTDTQITISGGNKVNFGITAKYANPGGWSYKWIRNGTPLPEGASTLTMTEQNTSETVTENVTYQVVATNMYEDKVWHKDTIEFQAIVRPQIIIPKEVQYEVNLREGDEMKLSATKGRGGYVNGWEYQWYKGTKITEEANKIAGADSSVLIRNTDVKDYYSSYSMSSRTEQYTLYFKNVDKPTNKTLDSGYIQYEVVIHRRPNMPLELIRKGSTSNIYIADMRNETNGLTNDRLSSNSYKFCFGYGDIEIVREDPTLRYQQYTKEQANKGPWVYTYWEYSDGYICKSDTVYYEGNTRGTTDIDDVYEGAAIKISGNGFTAESPSAMPAIARIVSTNGETVREMLYESNTTFNERFETQGLSTGFYIVEVTIGENREVNKIFINE